MLVCMLSWWHGLFSCVFFCKQKTAYEMRISDWSSDVCSSDLAGEAQIPESWPDGWAEYRSIRLDRLVAEANRYAVLPIMIDDPATAAFEVSGRFHVSQTERFADRIASLFGLSEIGRAHV